MSKHTPGPWDVFGAEDSSSGEWCELTVSQASMPFIRVCFMPSDGTETIMANARLIAAAPDLLEALKELVADVEALISESSGVYGLHLNGDVSPWDELVEGGRFERLSGLSMARAVIAKATGERS